MKKVFTLMVAAVMAVCANAQTIAFTESQVGKPGDGAEFSDNGLVIKLTDTDGKFAIDKNSAYYGTAASNVQYSYRLKSGGKSGSKNAITVTIPEAGTLNIAARTGSNNATDRTLVVTQNGTELYNKVVQETDATETITNDEGKETKIYPYVSVAVEKGELTIEYPVGSMNFYGFTLTGTAGINNVTAVEANTDAPVYNLAGQRVSKDTKGILIQNGKKFVNK